MNYKPRELMRSKDQNKEDRKSLKYQVGLALEDTSKNWMEIKPLMFLKWS